MTIFTGKNFKVTWKPEHISFEEFKDKFGLILPDYLNYPSIIQKICTQGEIKVTVPLAEPDDAFLALLSLYQLEKLEDVSPLNPLYHYTILSNLKKDVR